jgi:hypothetical protein
VSDETRRALEGVVGMVERLGRAQRARSARCAEEKDLGGCVTHEHGAMVCDQIARLIRDLLDE